MITFGILSKRLRLTRKELSDDNVASFTKKEHLFPVLDFKALKNL